MRMLLKSLTGVLCSLVVSVGMAGDGAIEIWEPTTITEPGKYVVTRNITTDGTVISIQNDDVTLDLNGFTLENTDASSAAIEVLPLSNVTIENGNIRAAYDGIAVPTGVPGDLIALVVRNTSVAADGTGMYFMPDSYVAKRILIESNRIKCGGQCLGGTFTNSEVRANSIECGPDGGTGMIFFSGGSNLIRDNTVTDCSWRGIMVLWGTGGNLIRGNVISGSDDAPEGVALEINNDDNNHVERNIITASHYGFWIGPSTDHTVYRGNTAQGCVIGFQVDNPSFNYSHGDNYMPDQM